jgi:ParB family transcriptional regulator, chromosome partitioning protein
MGNQEVIEARKVKIPDRAKYEVMKGAHQWPQPLTKKGNLYALDVNSIQPDPEQPRKYFDEQALAELSASITSHGVLQPILVRGGDDSRFLIVSGERRYQASLKAGLATIPAIITDDEPAEISIIENLLRENLTAIEEAEAVERLRAVHDYGLSDLATALGKSDSTLSEILSLNKLPTAVKDDCRNDPKAGRSILALIARQKTREKMTALYTKYKESGLSGPCAERYEWYLCTYRLLLIPFVVSGCQT